MKKQPRCYQHRAEAGRKLLVLLWLMLCLRAAGVWCWEVLDAFSTPSKHPRKRNLTSKHSSFPWRCWAPQITQPWVDSLASDGDLLLCFQRNRLRCFQPVAKNTGGSCQLSSGVATHCMSLHLTHWLLLAQVQAFRACAGETERVIPQTLHQLLPWGDKNSTLLKWPEAMPWLSSKLKRQNKLQCS